MITTCITDKQIDELENFYKSINIEETNSLNFDFKGSTDYKNTRFYKYEVDGNIVGLGSVCDDIYCFDNFKIFIHPNHRNNNFGGEILSYIIKEAIELKKLRIIGSFIGQKEKTVKLYEAKGFTVVKGKLFSQVVLKLK